MMGHRSPIEVSINEEAARIEERKLASLRRMSYLNRGFSKLGAVEPNKRLPVFRGGDLGRPQGRQLRSLGQPFLLEESQRLRGGGQSPQEGRRSPGGRPGALRAGGAAGPERRWRPRNHA